MPVLLPISGWDPAEPLHEWISGRLAADHPALRRMITGPDGRPRSLATELVVGGRVLPILEGLDEIIGSKHAAALAGVQAMSGQLPEFVLTCRTQAYENAVDVHGPLPGSAVVEIQPLNTRQASSYLIDGTDCGASRWGAVAEHLHTQPNAPLATVLATPLYTWLARVAYRRRDTDPNRLLDFIDHARTPDDIRTSIEFHLLDQLIPTTFTATVGGHPAHTAEQAATAGRHLAYLAAHLHGQNTTDLAWWRLEHALPRWQLRLSGGLAAGLTAGLVGWFLFALDGGHMARVLFGMEGAADGGLVIGLTAAAAAVFFSLSGLRRVEIKPRRLMVRLGVGLIIGLTGWFLTSHKAGFVFALPVVFGGWTRGIVDDHRASSPTVILREDRAATLVSVFTLGLTFGLMLGIAAGVAYGFLIGFAIGMAFGPTSALGFGPTYLWGRFLLVRVLLAWRGRVPLRLMTFLRESHDRGVLRQAGGVYQFRHSRLQERLARAGAPIDDVAPPAT